MISFVTWKWHSPDRIFLSHHVNVLHAMITRWYPRPFRLICITDDSDGLDSKIEAMDMPVRYEVQSPQGARFPSCYSRLWNFSRQATCLGERIFQLDIDVIICGDLQPLVDKPGDFVGWCDKRFQKNKIAGGAYMLKTGSMPHVWEDFDPQTSPAQAFAAGHTGSDQGWMSYKINPPGKWENDGLMKINWTPAHTRRVPPRARIVFTNGKMPPWDREQQRKYPWLKEAWKL